MKSFSKLIQKVFEKTDGDSLLASGGETANLPNYNELLLYTLDQQEDTIGRSTRDFQLKQTITGGTITLPDGITIDRYEGTGTITGGVISGTVYEIYDSNNNLYPWASDGVLWNVSGGDNLVVAGLTTATSLTTGSDWLNQKGFTVADGDQYIDDAGRTAVTTDVLIPALSDLSGCCAYVEVV